MSERPRSRNGTYFPGAVTVLSLAALLAFWWVLAWLVGDPGVLPGPLLVWGTMVEETVRGPLLYHSAVTLRRVLLGFGLAMAAGTAIGIAMGYWPRFDRWVEPWVLFFLNMPALVVIVLCYLWLGLSELAAIVAVMINKAAMVAVNMREGVRTLSPDIAEMSRIYRMSPLDHARHIVLPQLAPFLATSVRNGLAIIWKIVLVVEFLGRGDGVGFQIHTYFQLFDTAHVLAYAVFFSGVMFAIDFLLVQPMEARAGRWRRSPGGETGTPAR